MSKVNKWFGNFHVLKDIDLSIYKGNVLSSVGHRVQESPHL